MDYIVSSQGNDNIKAIMERNADEIKSIIGEILDLILVRAIQRNGILTGKFWL